MTHGPRVNTRLSLVEKVGELLALLRRAWCILNGGHYKVLNTESGTESVHVSLRCAACGYQTPGWLIGKLR